MELSFENISLKNLLELEYSLPAVNSFVAKENTSTVRMYVFVINLIFVFNLIFIVDLKRNPCVLWLLIKGAEGVNN